MKLTRDNKKPWLVTETSSWWEDLLGFGYWKMYIDTKHPLWQKWFIEQIEKYKKYKIVNGQLVNTEKA